MVCLELLLWIATVVLILAMNSIRALSAQVLYAYSSSTTVATVHVVCQMHITYYYIYSILLGVCILRARRVHT